MSNFNASDAHTTSPLIHWVDTGGTTRAPVPQDTLLGWIDAGHLPADTPTWWEGLDGWTTALQLRAAIAAGQPSAEETGSTPQAPAPQQQEAEQPSSSAEPASPSTEQGPAVEPAVGAVHEAPQHETTPVDADAQPEDGSAPLSTDQAIPSPEAALTAQFDDDDLDDTFVTLVDRSSELYDGSERATTIDDVFLGGVIAAFGDGGYVLTDAFTEGSLRSSGATSASQRMATPAHRHELRFEDPASGSRVALLVDHLTPDAGTVEVLGQRARLEVAYGERVPDFGQVGRAVREEAVSAFLVADEPGRVSFDADLAGGFVYCQVDLLAELDRYIDDEMSVDGELLRKHLAAVVHTLRKTLRMRFGD